MCHYVKPSDLHGLVERSFLTHRKDVHEVVGGHLNPSNLRKHTVVGTGKRWRNANVGSWRENPYETSTTIKYAADEILVRKVGCLFLQNSLVDCTAGTSKKALPKVQNKKLLAKKKADARSELSEIKLEAFVASELAKFNGKNERRAEARELLEDEITVASSVPSEMRIEAFVLSELSKLKEGPSRRSKTQLIVPAKKSASRSGPKPRMRDLTETLKLPELMLPSVNENVRVPPSLRNPHPTMKQKVQEMTDKVFVTTHLTGVTQKDRFQKCLDFDRNVLHRYEEKETNLRNGHKAAEHLEQKLVRRLLELNDRSGEQSYPVDFGRLQVYGEVWNDLCADSSTFGPILFQIKGEYDTYYSKLLGVVESTNIGELVDCLNVAGELTKFSKSDMEQKRADVEALEEEGRNGILKNSKLHRRIEQEEHRIAEGKKQRENEEKISRRLLIPLERLRKQSKGRKISKPVSPKKEKSMGDRLQELRVKISKDLREIANTRKELKTKYVPKTLYSNALLAIQDTENRMQKLMQQNEYLTNNTKVQQDLLDDELNRFGQISLNAVDELLSVSDVS